MANVPNQKIIEKYKELLANRTHDVIAMTLAIEILEAQVTELSNEKSALERENTKLKHLAEEGPPNNPVVQGEVISNQ